ncbi:Aspartyl/glutamyl-tRNA(Asn/Gln) amidotransferase subunit C [Sulfurimonas gotlandica GD1]|uniref:Aspartyl/glutamyl-tRNA(Asn/Gln) amidotransferase subunit C n=1 Tax=Sulfurimonas gotlandica (strain DSM 19862 / JCM 16533 / GD1) TaxID=929558 RepID=B6BN91_SULGG|nr:Asp-tRNA(Asn)/Glu-tRNA(Gln) amidotransferase subunit GatC [Sulfurimonas gotlandica]EDZ61322.1 glutamyl-tRNA(Gln) amidotransferase, C subunit [Sulfurimonas gotlandica GD1]EHP30961.1 Aspartyl/glutamyl-tRNA(Asn/Gln) amidotransferase subunit C [Sulfurimonas gotlandica GD1]
MQVDDVLLTKLEKLSFLKVSEDKREEIIGQLSEIVSFVDNLSSLNTDGVDDNFAMSDNGTFTREDTPFCDASVNDNILKNAPLSGDHFFIVPKIIE